jgi:hypothetical protein
MDENEITEDKFWEIIERIFPGANRHKTINFPISKSTKTMVFLDGFSITINKYHDTETNTSIFVGYNQEHDTLVRQVKVQS